MSDSRPRTARVRGRQRLSAGRGRAGFFARRRPRARRPMVALGRRGCGAGSGCPRDGGVPGSSRGDDRVPDVRGSPSDGEGAGPAAAVRRKGTCRVLRPQRLALGPACLRVKHETRQTEDGEPGAAPTHPPGPGPRLRHPARTPRLRHPARAPGSSPRLGPCGSRPGLQLQPPARTKNPEPRTQNPEPRTRAPTREPSRPITPGLSLEWNRLNFVHVAQVSAPHGHSRPRAHLSTQDARRRTRTWTPS